MFKICEKHKKLLPAKKFFAFKKAPFRYYRYSVYNRYILVRLWVKVFVSQRWLQPSIIVHTLSFSVNLMRVTLEHFTTNFWSYLQSQ